MEYVFDYMGDPELRHGLNTLTRDTFGFDFEGWVAAGDWEGDYVPHSLREGGRTLSNVSANRMVFSLDGQEMRCWQLGTVMTAKDRRNEGLAARLMDKVVSLYGNDGEGIYLFGNLNAVGFYRKMGFEPITETRYTVRELPSVLSPLRPARQEDLPAYIRAVRSAHPNARLDQVNRYGLQMFYTRSLENVYCDPKEDIWIVLEAEGEEACLKSVICPRPLSLAEILPRLPVRCEKLRLGFAPLPGDEALCDSEPYDGGDDYRLMIRGDGLRRIQEERLIFPALSHA